MAASRITCPDCKSVLKPAKPVPDGKKVKCPKCGKMFTTPGLVQEEEKLRPAKAPPAKAKAGIKKATAPKPAPKKPVEEEEEESGGVYATVQEREKTAEEAEETNIEYAPDMSIKDLRGPAQAAVVQPSNYLLLVGGLCCLSDILIICFCFWPMVFSDYIINYEHFLEKYYKDKGGKDAATKIKSIPKERKDVKDKEALDALDDAEHEEFKIRWMVMGGFMFLLIYNGITVFGAVKLQNLESRRWGIACSVMTFLPFGAGGLSTLIGGGFFLSVGAALFDDSASQWLYSCILGGLVYAVAIVVGAWALRVLLSEEVVAGFEYVAE